MAETAPTARTARPWNHHGEDSSQPVDVREKPDPGAGLERHRTEKTWEWLRRANKPNARRRKKEQTARRKVAGMADRALKKKRRLEVFAVERKRRFPNLREVR